MGQGGHGCGLEELPGLCLASTTSCPSLPIHFFSAPPTQETRTSQTSPLLLSSSPGSLSSGQEWGGVGGREGCAPRDPQGSVVDRSRCGDTGMLAPPAAPVHPWHRPQVEAAATAACPTPIHLSPQNPTVPASLLVPRSHCMLQRQVHSWGLPVNSH